MKKQIKTRYIIQTFNVLEPNQRGFMLDPQTANTTQIHMFPSKRAARKHLKKHKNKLQLGWVHVITKCSIAIPQRGGQS